MALIEILQSQVVDLPYKHSAEETIRELLRRNFKSYFMHLKTNDEVTPEMLVKTKKVIMTIDEAINNYYIGKLSKAYECINQLMNGTTEEFDRMSRFYRGLIPNIYYRMRKSQEVLTNKKELFHVPFDKRYVIGNERYSTAGYPCLYLGSTPYTCWEEYNRPGEQEGLYFSKYELPSEYKYIELALLPYELKDRYFKGEVNDLTILKSYITILPIIMACSIRVPDSIKQEPFKGEYVIPQLISQWLISTNNEYDGISYFSVAATTYSKKNYRLYQNLAIPVKSIEERGYCKELMKHIKFTDPVCRIINKHEEVDGFNIDTFHYLDSIFADIEMELNQKPCTSLNGINY